MSDSRTPGTPRVELPPRFLGQGYSTEDVARRRTWVEEQTGVRFHHVAHSSLPSAELQGNIENPIGAVQVPLGVAGPLKILGLNAQGIFYVPLATTEGALVRSYERGMVAITRAGGAQVRIHEDQNRVAPIFRLPDVAAAADFVYQVENQFEEIRQQAESTTSHGKLLRIACHPVGREVIVEFRFFTADAQGMNMIVKATEQACQWITQHTAAQRYLIFSGYNGEKRATGSSLAGGKGKKVTAGVRLPRRTVQAVLRTTADRLVEMWRLTVLGHLQTASIGYNGHYANGLTALFIACGQDVANVANAAVGITHFEALEDGGVYASVTLPSLTVATVGGGTNLGTSRECLEMLGCAGPGGAPKLAEITAATLLAGELSMGAAIASGELVDAHEAYGRNRPRAAEAPREGP